MSSRKTAPSLRFRGFSEPWEEKEFNEIFYYSIPNNTLSRAELSYEDGSVYNVHYGDVLIKYGSILDIQCDKIPRIPNKNFSDFKGALLQDGDIIIADTAEDETVGKVCEISNLQDSNVVSGLHTLAFRANDKMALGYLGYYLNSEAYHRQLLPLMQGIKVLSLSKSNIQKTIVRYSGSKNEQKQLADYFRNLDRLIALEQRKYDKLNTVKKSMLEKMFPQKGAKVPEIRFKGFSEPWEEKKLGDVGTITTGNTPSTSISGYYSEDGILWVTPTDIIENITFQSTRKLSKLGQQVARVVPKHTILVTCIASIGKNTMLGTNGCFNQQINGLTPDEDKYDSYFLLTESYLWSSQMKTFAASGTMQIVNKTEFSELKTLIPNLKEQQAIGSYFQNLDRLITSQGRKIEKLRNLKKACLEKMFV